MMAASPMMISVASMNQVKVSAVQEVIDSYPTLQPAHVFGLKVPSGVSKQPTTFEETISGAKIRAERAYQECDLSIGLESGLQKIPGPDNDYFDICVCSVFDGQQHHLGLSSGFRLPHQVVHLIVSKGMDLNEAMEACGLTSDLSLGAHEGAIGIFSRGRMDRKDHCKQAIITALTSVENPEMFSKESSQKQLITK